MARRHPSLPSGLVGLLLLASAAPARAERPPGAEIDPAVAVDVTAAGFEQIPRLVPSFIPEDLGLGDIVAADQAPYSCAICDLHIPFVNECRPNCCAPGECLLGGTPWLYEVAVTDLDLGFSLRDLDLVPADGQIDLSADARVQLNAPPPDEAQVYARVRVRADILGASFDAVDLSESCGLWVAPFNVALESAIGVDVIDPGTPAASFDATVDPIAWDWTLDGSDIQFEDCALGNIQDAFDGDLFDLIGFNPWEWAVDQVLGLVEGAIDGPIQELGPEVEAALEDALAAARVDESFEIGGSAVDVALYPSDVAISPAGMRLVLGGRFDAEVHPCVAAWAGEGSRQTPGGPPALGLAPSGVPAAHHLGVLLDDDLANQALYALWSAGLLCATLEDDGSVPLNTALLQALAGDAFAELFPEPQPMRISTRPAAPPIAIPGGAHDLTASIAELGVDFQASLDHRMTRVFGAQLATDVGVDLAWAGATGELGVDVTFDPAAIDTTVDYVELVPGAEEEIADNLGGLFEAVAGPILGSALDGIAFGLPSLEGLGVVRFSFAASGPAGDWLGAYTHLGLVQYDNGGCDGAGCADPGASCGGGCVTGGQTVPAGLGYGLVLIAVGWARRRGGSTRATA